jgi:hypothetical protein
MWRWPAGPCCLLRTRFRNERVLCGYHAQWANLAVDLLHAPEPKNKNNPELDAGHNWIAYRDGWDEKQNFIITKQLLGILKLNLTKVMAENEIVTEGNLRGHGYYSKMLYDPWVGAQVHYTKRGQEIVANDQYAIIRATPNDPKFPQVLSFFQQKVTAQKAAVLEWDPEGQKTKWKFDTYGSIGGSKGPVGGAGGTILLYDPSGKDWRFGFLGTGPAAGLPVPLLKNSRFKTHLRGAKFIPYEIFRSSG